MKILIAGATGTLGLPLIREMIALGYEMTGVARTEDKAFLLQQLGARAVVADALDEAALSAAIARTAPDIVIDLLTAIPKEGPKRPEDMTLTDRLRVQGTDNLLRASVAAGVKRIIAESMIFVYGYGDHGPDKLTEEDDLQPETFPEMQETVGSLRYLEKRLLEANRSGLINAIILRFGLLYGARVPATQAALQMVRERKLPVLSSGDGSKSWIHLDDAVAALVAAIERGSNGQIYNIADDEPAGYRDFILAAANIVRAPQPLSVSPWSLSVASPYTAIALTARLCVSNEKAKKELGWQPRYSDYYAGLQEIAAGLLEKKAA